MNLFKEPLYVDTVTEQGWSPEELSKPFDLERLLFGCPSMILLEWDNGAPDDHTYTSHNGEETTTIIVTDGTELL
jgi:hypothetical protein